MSAKGVPTWQWIVACVAAMALATSQDNTPDLQQMRGEVGEWLVDYALDVGEAATAAQNR